MLQVSISDGLGGVRVVVVSGEVDMQSSPRLLEALREALRAAAALKVRLAEVSYIDSSGVAVLIQGFKLARKTGRPFVLLEPSARVLSVLELSQLRDFFAIEEGDGSGDTRL